MSMRMVNVAVTLPPGEEQRAKCVACLKDRVARLRGVAAVGLETSAPQGSVLVRYDPGLITLEALKREVERASGGLETCYAQVILPIAGMHSVDAARRIERSLFGVPGVYSANANYSAGTLRLEFDRRECPMPEVVRRLDRAGFRAMPSPDALLTPPRYQRKSAANWLAAKAWALSHVEMSLVALGGVLLVAGWLVGMVGSDPGWQVARVALLLCSAICTSTETWPEAWQFIKKFRLDVDVLMFAAAIGAASLGHYEEGALLLFLFGLGSAGEHLALSRARSSIEALTKVAPDTAVRVSGEAVPVEAVKAGELLVVNPFQRVPVDGVVREGSSSIDQSAVTGESVPVEKGPRAELFAGTINTSGRLTMECVRPAKESTLSRIIQLVEEAQSTKSRTQLFTDRVEQFYVPTVFAVTAGLIVALPLLAGVTWGVGFYRAMAFLTAASPCALAIGTPAATLCAIARAAKIGAIIKGGVHLESLAKVKAVALDKTGTLTTGKLSVTDVVTLGSLDERELLRLTAAVEATSAHPLATAVVAHAKGLGLQLPAVEDPEQIAAKGISAWVEGKRVFAGKAGPEFAGYSQLGDMRAKGRAIIGVTVEGKPVGLLALADTVRPTAARAVQELHQLGVTRAMMLTGDHVAAAEAVAKQVGLDVVHADLLPEDKLRHLEKTAAEVGPVAMVGDGINDAPALARASVGIAMGGAASPVAMETADVVLLGEDLSRLPAVFALAQRTRRIVTQNLIIALGVIAVVAPIAAMGRAPLSVAVFLHEGSTIVVVLNSLRLLRGK